MLLHRQGAEGDLGHEAQGTLRADHQVLQDVHRLVVVGEGVDAVAHGVLHGVLLGDLGHRLGVLAHAVAQLRQALPQGGLGPMQLRVGIGLCGVDDGARGEHQHHRLKGVVGVELGAAGHARRVVGHDAADGAGDLGRRVGTQLVAIARQVCVDVADGGAGLTAHPCAAVEHLHLAEVLAHVQEDRIAQRLARQAGATGAEGHGAVLAIGLGHRVRHLGGVGGRDDHLGDEQIVRCVMGHSDSIDESSGSHCLLGCRGRHCASLCARILVDARARMPRRSVRTGIPWFWGPKSIGPTNYQHTLCGPAPKYAGHRGRGPNRAFPTRIKGWKYLCHSVGFSGPGRTKPASIRLSFPLRRR